MACGTPVIAADASSLPEVAGSAGLLVPPHDVEAWGLALERALDDADWRRATREQGFLKAARYAWSLTAQHTAASYRKALYT